MHSNRLPEVVVEGKINLNPKAIIQNLRWNDYHPGPLNDNEEHGNGPIEIWRFLRNDKFSIKFGKVMFDQDSMMPYVSINNRTLIAGEHSSVMNAYRSLHNNFSQYIVHYSTIESTLLHDCSIITIGYDREHSAEVFPSLMVGRYLLTPTFDPIQQNINSTFDKVIHIKTVKIFRVENKEDFKYVNDINGDKRGELKVTPIYNHMYLVPRPLNRTGGNKVLFDVYGINDSESSTDYDFDISSKGMTSTSFLRNKMGVSFHSIRHSKERYQPLNGKPAILMGTIETDDYSYYDYEKKQTVVGASSQAQAGEVIPYNLKGSYHRSINLSINCDFKNLQINLSHDFADPILDPYSGQVQLSVHDTTTNARRIYQIDAKDVPIVKRENLSLEGLIRLNHHEED